MADTHLPRDVYKQNSQIRVVEWLRYTNSKDDLSLHFVVVGYIKLRKRFSLVLLRKFQILFQQLDDMFWNLLIIDQTSKYKQESGKRVYNGPGKDSLFSSIRQKIISF